MAKKLVYNYTFNPGASGVGNIVIEGNHPEKTFLLVTNTTDNIIIYNFSATGYGGTTYYDAAIDHTTLYLDYNTSAMNSTDSLQVFIDVQEEKIDFSETFVDPVSKFRVSEPQNLIDTDFEYGLQPTKWETVELVNNIPSFYANSADYTIANIVKVETIAGSENITVITGEPHGLVVGSPIDVQGVASRTAEGKFLITAVPSTTTFVYRSKGTQLTTGVINGAYTTITPGQFYVGSEINIDESKGVATDGLTNTTLSIETEYTHGFDPGTSVYITNTLGKERYNVTVGLGSTAPDGRPYVDFEDTLSVNLTVDSTQTETKEMTGTYAYKFNSSAVSVANDTIEWPNHQLQSGDVLLYVPPAGDTEIGGLQRFQIYYVRTTPTTDTITLCETTNGNFSGNEIIDITSQGTSNYGRHQLILGYEISYASKNTNQYESYFYTRRYWNGSGSGRDLYTYSVDPTINRGGYYGLGGVNPSRVMTVQKSTASPQMSTIIHAAPMYSTRDNANFTFGKSGTTPDGYDFIEDYFRFENYYYQNNFYNYWYFFSPGYFYGPFINQFIYNQQASQTYNAGTTFIFLLKKDTESDSLYIADHGLSSGSLATLTTNSGSAPTYRTDTSTFYASSPTTSSLSSPATSSIIAVSPNRIRLNSASRLNTASGSYTLSGSLNNTTANSIYLGSNNLVSNQTVFLSAVDGGVLPTTTTGTVQPDSNTITSVYSSLTTALTSIKGTMGGDSTNLVLTGSNHSTPITSTFLNTDSGIQYIYLSRSQLYLQTYNGSSYTGYSGQLPSNGFATGQIYDYMSNTAYAGLGYNMITTPYAQNTAIPYWVDLFQVPYQPGIVNSTLYYNSWFAYSYSTNGTLDNRNDSYTNWDTSLGGGWRYHYDTNYIIPQGVNSYHGYICMVIIIDNSNWDGYFSTPSPNIYYPNGRYMLPYTFGFMGQRYVANVIIPVKAGTTSSRYGPSGSILTNAQIASTIATEIANALVNPSFSGQTNQEARVDVISGNRIRLKTAGNSNYNFTNSGTAPISLETDEIIGAIDGYYDITASTPTIADIQLNREIPKRNISLTSSDFVTVGDVVYINKSGHKLNTAQQVVFDETNAANSISGLTSGTTYYAVPAGPSYLSLAESKQNAIGGNIIGIGTTSAGTFSLTVPSISGIASGPGTVGITSDLKTFTGTGTLFKRFFKAGDKFKVEDTSTSPSSYKEFNIASVIDDTILTVDEIPGTTLAETSYYIQTKVNVRPDGTNLHRPFDGGVEITAGTSPNSSIARQTRKYFRYQSGKGIQCSLAINFNPSRVANTLVSSANTSLPSESYEIFVNNNDSSSYNLSGSDRNASVFGQNPEVVISQGDTVEFIVNSPGHPFWIKTAAVTGTGSSVTTGITNNGTDSGRITWNSTGITTGTYYYQCENHATMNGAIIVEPVGITTTIAKLTTKYPHGITRANSVTIKGSSDATYNGTFDVKASDDFTFSYYLPSVPNSSVPDGIIEYNIDSWANSAIRAGLFDYQNGFFFEFDGSTLYAVRRSSVQQLPGYASVQKNSNIVLGTDTNFDGQLQVGQYVVIRGGSYKITRLVSDNEMHIQPAYRGVSAADAIVTKTVDTKVPQNQWNIDKADGTGPSGFLLDITKIQMAYLDYSWYGAGKIRFGFKDTYGHVKYMHEFRHNNRLEEAYMRSGNIPGRYEIENTGTPTYVPSLFHWGTSVIMDGKFDDDKAYLFTASSNSLIFTNGASVTATTNANSQLTSQYDFRTRQYDWYVRLSFPVADASKFSTGTKLYTSNKALDGEQVAYTQYSGSNFYVYIFIQRSRSTPAIYPTVNTSTVVNIGAPASGGTVVDLTKDIPLISIRLAPSVDNNLTGSVGQREIINRMQLQLKSLGMTLSHDCEVDLILNGSISNTNFSSVNNPSLSQLVRHSANDQVIGGTIIFSLRASGGAPQTTGKRLSATTDFDLSQITDLGNSMLGGDEVYPNGPDLLTISIKPIDTSEISATQPLTVSSRITWTESQA